MDSSPPPGAGQELLTSVPLYPNDVAAQATPTPTPAPLEENAIAGPSTTPVPTAPKRVYRRPKPRADGLVAYTVAHVPGLYNIKNPAGDFVQREANVDVVRQVSQARAKRQKAEMEEDRARQLEQGEQVPDLSHPLAHTLIIHPGSRNLRFGRASDFYPKEVPNCIARHAAAPHRGRDPPVPGAKAKRELEDGEGKEGKKRKGENGVVNGETNGHDDQVSDSVDTKIGYLRDYLKEKLRANRLATDWREGTRVKATNAKVRPENIPEHNDPYRIDWTELEGKKFFVGQEALRLPPSSGFKVRYPILNRTLNTRDWQSSQLLLDDLSLILTESLRTELDIHQRDYHKYSVVLLVPDHGDRTYVEEMTNLILSVMGFKEIAVHQEAYAAIFSAGMSSACVVDIGANVTSVACVDEGNLNADTRITLAYGGNDITTSLVALLQRSAFPYRELDLTRSQDWLMMDNLKIKICTLEEHLVASTQWDFYVLKPEGLTQKYLFRTYDENILAPLCFFDTRMIDFEEKKGEGPFQFWNTSEDIETMLTTTYNEPTGAMKACTAHLLPPPPPPVEATPVPVSDVEKEEAPIDNGMNGSPEKPINGVAPIVESEIIAQTPVGSEIKPAPTPSRAATPVPAAPVIELANEEILRESSRVPLDAAIAASISLCGTENKVKAAASTILLIGGSSALKGLGTFIAERLPPLLRAKNFPIDSVSIVPPPRNLNPRFVSWKGASVMCNLESLSDMWIRRDEWEAVGVRALKDRYLFF